MLPRSSAETSRPIESQEAMSAHSTQPSDIFSAQFYSSTEEEVTWNVLRHLPDVQEATYFDKDGRSSRLDGGFLSFSEVKRVERGNRTELDTQRQVIDKIEQSQWYKEMTTDTHLLLSADNAFAHKLMTHAEDLVKIGREIDQGEAIAVYSKASFQGQELHQSLYQSLASSKKDEFNKKLRELPNIIEKHLEEKLDYLENSYHDSPHGISYKEEFNFQVSLIEDSQSKKVIKDIFTEQWNKLVAKRGLPPV